MKCTFEFILLTFIHLLQCLHSYLEVSINKINLIIVSISVTLSCTLIVVVHSFIRVLLLVRIGCSLVSFTKLWRSITTCISHDEQFLCITIEFSCKTQTFARVYPVYQTCFNHLCHFIYTEPCIMLNYSIY